MVAMHACCKGLLLQVHAIRAAAGGARRRRCWYITPDAKHIRTGPWPAGMGRGLEGSALPCSWTARQWPCLPLRMRELARLRLGHACM